MAYASLLSGITLANAGLGIVHSLSSVLGGLFPIPHGIICGTLLAEGTRINIETLLSIEPNSKAVQKHALAGRILSGEPELNDRTACQTLVSILYTWTQTLALPRLGAYGVTAEHIPAIVSQAAIRNNPVSLTAQSIQALLIARI
jgi:alcohol dehydrogenase